MNGQMRVLIALFGLMAAPAFSSEQKNPSFLFPDESSRSSIAVSGVDDGLTRRKPETPEMKNRGTLLHLKAGSAEFREANFANDYSNFHYSDAQGSSFGLGAQYDALRAAGLWGAYFELGMTTFSGEVAGKGSTRQQTRLTLVPVTAGVVYTADLYRPMRYFLPSVSFGVTQNLYLHNGTEDQLRARGNYISTRTALGVRHSLDWMGFDDLSLMGEFASARSNENRTSTVMLGLTSEL